MTNQGTARNHDLGAVMVSERSDARLVLSVFDAEPRCLPRRLAVLECHPYSAQAIVPMQGADWAVVVCHSGQGGRPALESLRAFRFGASEGVIYAPGIWHHPIIALDQRSLFFVQSWQCGTPSDCIVEAFDDIRVILTA